MRIYLIGAAAIALAASGVSADPGKGHGGEKDHGNGGGKAAAGPSMSGNQGHGKQAKAAPARQAKADHGQPAHVAQAKAKAERPAQHKAAPAVAQRSAHGNGNGNGKADNVRVVKSQAGDVRQVRDVRQARDVRQVREVRAQDRNRNDPRIVRTVVHFDRRGDRGVIEGCPPGLAKKHNGCQPPGLAKQRNTTYRTDYYRPSWFGYTSARDGRYRYDNGYLYRMNDGGSVLGYIPLLGGALSVGNSWPSYYEPVPVPDYYVNYYNLGSPNGYRYADDVLYRVDPQSDAITSIAALLTGDQFGIGQRMPAGYDVYNVPYAYRDQYYDTPQYDYRYSDGYVYQVDPTTQLIQAAIQLLT